MDDIKVLTDDHRRIIGTAVAVAKADGVFDDKEKKVFEELCEQLRLVEQAKEEIAEFFTLPPRPAQIAGWALTRQDRLGTYMIGLSMAQADGVIHPTETTFLKELAHAMELSAEDIHEAIAQSGIKVDHER
jgi:tellurite resistance protein